MSRVEPGRVTGVRGDRERRAEVVASGRPPPELDLPEEVGTLDRRHDEPDLARHHDAGRLQEARPSVPEVLENA